MGKAKPGLAHLPGIRPKSLKVEHRLLREQAAEALREHISSGRVPEGTRLTEREVAHLLGISQMTAHEALIILEAEGLVVSRSDGRYVIELAEKDVRDIHELRWTLELPAAERAAANISDENRQVLNDRLVEMEAALDSRDSAACTRCDTAFMLPSHRRIVEPILAGDVEGAGREMVQHLKAGLAESLRTFHLSERAGAEDV
jgi:DNA-binding GntR family transcriptional regulator